MKFIGQFIQDFIARFRNDVFLENIADGTVANDKFLGLDSNNKIVKEVISSSSGDIEGVTAGTGLTGGGTSGTVTLNVSGLTLNEFIASSIITSSNSYVDSDTRLMTAAAITDRILSFGYTTNTGDITSVQLTTDSGNVSTASGDVNHSIAGGNAINTAVSEGKVVINHNDTSEQASVTNSVRTYIQNITLDTYGHVTALASATETVTNTNQLTEFTLTGDSGSNQTIAHGNTLDIAGGNAISTVVGATDTVTINHNDTSSQASVNNSGRTYIQDIVLDTYGHVTGLTSATETVTNTDTNTTYAVSALDGDDSSQKAIVLSGSDGSTDGVTISASTGLSISRSDQKIILSCDVTDTNTQLTNSQVRAAVEAASDSNVFTDADHTKLNGIEASATADQTADEIRALLGTGNRNLVPAAGVDGQFLKHDGTFGSPSYTVVTNSSTSTSGIVELATTGEADTGTDTSRAVTPAGLKSHVDTRFSYQYVSFTGNANISTNWAIPGTNGPFTHNYNTDLGTNGTTVGSTSSNIARAKQNGFIVPYDNAVLCGFYGMMRNNTANNQGALGLFHSTYATFGARTATSAFTLQAYAVGDQTGGGGSNYQGFTKVVDLSRSLDLTAGDIIIPAILQANEKAYAQFTIVIKTPLL